MMSLSLRHACPSHSLLPILDVTRSRGEHTLDKFERTFQGRSASHSVSQDPTDGARSRDCVLPKAASTL
jgi:hypothetical protein